MAGGADPDAADPDAAGAAAAAAAAEVEEAERKLNWAFAGLPSGSEAPSEESVKTAERAGFGSTNQFVYGEAAPGPVAPVLAGLGVQSEDVFYDLGSGRGRLVLGAALLPESCKSAPSRAVGVELDTKRHVVAEKARTRPSRADPSRAATTGPCERRRLSPFVAPSRPTDCKKAAALLCPLVRQCTLLNEDVLTTSLGDATFLFCNNAVFGQPLYGAIASTMCKAKAPALRVATSTAPLPWAQASVAGLALQRISVLPVNWSGSGHTLYRYGRERPKDGLVTVDEATTHMIDGMRRQASGDNEMSNTSRDMAFMRIAAFIEQMNAEVKEWQEFYAKEV
mmetsp:Transcript_144291/g.461220  ORF Transcript_144291/g.461220 Transcript_144291/m.461220 type:complete len:338 (+) Transcript_144291:72-1085(+)